MSDTQSLWEVIPSRTEPHWLEIRDPDGWWEAFVKWDGCIELAHAGNMPFDDVHGHSWDNRPETAVDGGIHICHIDGLISRLQALKAAAQIHFGTEWPA